MGEGDWLKRLTMIPGISRTSAEVLLPEIRVDVGQFPAAYHMLRRGTTCQDSWPKALLAPGQRRAAQRLAQRLRYLGYEVAMHKAA